MRGRIGSGRTGSRLVLVATALTLAASQAPAGTSAAASSPADVYLVVWAGDWNIGDVSSAEVARLEGDGWAASAGIGPDFLAVVDADPASDTYRKVVSTLPVPGVENEPHHMQYRWQRGERVYAGGLYGDRTFVFDVDDVPDVRLVGVVEPQDTPCGSVPDAYWVLGDGTAFGTYMGGPNVAGDPRCNGGVNNGFAGTPGTIVRIGPDASVLGEFSAAGDFEAPHPNDWGRPARCASNPPLARASCANPHGIQAREDLGIMITSDYAEPRNVPTDPVDPPDPNVFRDTVRTWEINDPGSPRLRSVSVMPIGSMGFAPPPNPDPKGVMGIMETTVTNLPQHRGAFASSMCGGQIWYTADVTSLNPMWRQVFDATAAAVHLDGRTERLDGCVGAGWLQTSPDDTLLFQAVIGRNPGTLGPDDPGVPKMVYALDIRDLLSVPVAEWTQTNPDVCTISVEAEVFLGGGYDADGVPRPAERCPRVTGTVDLGPSSPVGDVTSGGPHWGAIDNFSLDQDAGRISSVTRIAASTYFVARAAIDGSHKVCTITVGADGTLELDGTFTDENTAEACVNFDRLAWPHGEHGYAKPHSMLFVASAGSGN
jgi:hypothetical protein